MCITFDIFNNLSVDSILWIYNVTPSWRINLLYSEERLHDPNDLCWFVKIDIMLGNIKNTILFWNFWIVSIHRNSSAYKKRKTNYEIFNWPRYLAFETYFIYINIWISFFRFYILEKYRFVWNYWNFQWELSSKLYFLILKKKGLRFKT